MGMGDAGPHAASLSELSSSPAICSAASPLSCLTHPFPESPLLPSAQPPVPRSPGPLSELSPSWVACQLQPPRAPTAPVPVSSPLPLCPLSPSGLLPDLPWYLVVPPSPVPPVGHKAPSPPSPRVCTPHPQMSTAVSPGSSSSGLPFLHTLPWTPKGRHTVTLLTTHTLRTGASPTGLCQDPGVWP